MAPLREIPANRPKHLRRPRSQAARAVEQEDRGELSTGRRRELLDGDPSGAALILVDAFLHVGIGPRRLERDEQCEGPRQVPRRSAHGDTPDGVGAVSYRLHALA